MGQISKQGLLSTGATKIFTAPLNKSYVSTLLMFNNPSVAYNIEVQRHDASEGNTVVLCSLTLDPGDTVFDTTGYPLNQLDTLTIISSVATTTYLATFIEPGVQV
jgi:hypothetical protein